MSRLIKGIALASLLLAGPLVMSQTSAESFAVLGVI